MSFLTDGMPDSLCGLPIHTDFRVMLRFEQLLFSHLPAEQIIDRAARLIFAVPVRVSGPLWEGILWYYRCGRPEEGKPHADKAHSGARAYDYEQDAALLCAAFQQTYGVDLTTAKMHWWRFKALFDGLPNDCRICKIMEYRTADTSDMPDKAREFYDRMRRRYALDAPRFARECVTVKQHDEAFIKRLRHE